MPNCWYNAIKSGGNPWTSRYFRATSLPRSIKTGNDRAVRPAWSNTVSKGCPGGSVRIAQSTSGVTTTNEAPRACYCCHRALQSSLLHVAVRSPHTAIEHQHERSLRQQRLRMHQSALLIREGKARRDIARLQDSLPNARLGQIGERLVDEGEGFDGHSRAHAAWNALSSALSDPLGKMGRLSVISASCL